MFLLSVSRAVGLSLRSCPQGTLGGVWGSLWLLIEGRCWCRVGGGRGCRSAPHSAQSAPSPTRAHLSSLRCPVRLRKLLTPSVWAGLAGTAKPAEGSSGALCVVLAHVPTPGSPGAPEQRCGHHGWLSALAGGVQPPREAFWLCFLLCKEPVLGGGFLASSWSALPPVPQPFCETGCDLGPPWAVSWEPSSLPRRPLPPPLHSAGFTEPHGACRGDCAGSCSSPHACAAGRPAGVI